MVFCLFFFPPPPFGVVVRNLKCLTKACLREKKFRKFTTLLCCLFFLVCFCFSFSFFCCCWNKLETMFILIEILLASLASVWLFLPACMLTWESSFAIAAIIVTQLTTPYIRIAPAAGDDQLTGQMFKYR